MATVTKMRFTPLGDIDSYVPTPDRPVRVRSRLMPADTHFEPHSHAWAQLSYCASGILQVTAASPDEMTCILPPSRAVWIAPDARHSVHVLEAAEFRTVYIAAKVTPAGWNGCRVLVVSPLLRELIQALDAPTHAGREALLSDLLINELALADTHVLGIPLPHPQTGDKRLRNLCEAVMRAPSQRATLADWASDIGASERTVARLFREELGLSYQQWRQQAILAHALPMLAGGSPVSQVAAASGYASDSAFSAMFKSAMGQPPSHFQGRAA